MSLHLLTKRLAKHGRFLLRNIWNREIHFNILEQKQNRTLQARLPRAAANVLRNSTANSTVARNAIQAVVHSSPSVNSASSAASGIFRFGQHARKIFIDNILNRVTPTYSSELRQQATKKLFFGDSAPFFALIGVSLASGAGVLTKEDELEGVCLEIREAANRLQSNLSFDETALTLDADFNVDKLDIGAPIAKGCAAVVYAAALKDTKPQPAVELDGISIPSMDSSSTGTETSGSLTSRSQQYTPSPRQPIVMTPIQNISRFVHNFGGSVDNINLYNQPSPTYSMLAENFSKVRERESEADITKTSSVIINEARDMSRTEDYDHENINESFPDLERYPLALKMMFNYDIQSNALSILRAMYKETVPARQRNVSPVSSNWERYIQDQTLTLPAHPFIVNMLGFFCDEVRSFPNGNLLYPSAQPQRINPNGYGRNMSLFLLMKRYNLSLRNLLDSQELNTRTKLLLLAQLLEAIAHINRHGIAHRDLKSDNILIELNDDGSYPILVLSDFGCCLADKIHGLQLPYTSQDIDKGGNAALMAPEIIKKQPGPFAVLNYAKSDLWACGAIAYEIFGFANPFYASNVHGFGAEHGFNSLRNDNYKVTDLPTLSDTCPPIVQQLILNILNPNPSKRLSPDIAANVMQLFLWAPSKWLKPGGMPNSPEVLQWLLSLTTKVMCEGRPAVLSTQTSPRYNLLYKQTGRRTYVEYLLICSFLARVRLRRLRGALNWIQDIV